MTTQLPTIATASLPDSLKLWLEEWKESDPIPQEMISLIPGALRVMDTQLRRIDHRELMVKLVRTLSLWKAPGGWDDIVEFYVEALEDMPADLATLALKRLRLNFRFDTFPKPADPRAMASAELTERHLMRARLKVASIYAPVLTPYTPPTVDQIAAAKSLKNAAVDHLRSATPTLSAAVAEVTPPTPDYLSRVRDEVKGFKLPDEDDPIVQKLLRQMEPKGEA